MRIALVSIKWIKHKVTKQLHWVMSLTITDAEADSLTYLKLFWWTEQKSKNLINPALIGDMPVGTNYKWRVISVQPWTYTVSIQTGACYVQKKEEWANIGQTRCETETPITLRLTQAWEVRIYGGVWVSADTVISRQPQLEEGSEATAYQPYAWTPTPDNPIDITSNNGAIKWGATSKNLFDKDQTPYQSWNYIYTATIGNTSFAPTPNANYNIYRIEIKPNTTYTFGTIKANAPMRVVTDGTTILDSATNGAWVDWRNITITTGATAKYLYLSVWVVWTYKCDDILQLEIGSEHTSYVPYTAWIYCAWPIETVQDSLWNTATAEMLLKVWNYQDEQDVISGSVTRKVGIKVLDWTESWDTTSTSHLYLLRWATEVALPSQSICTHYIVEPTTTSWANMQDKSIRYWVTWYSDRIYIKDSSVWNLAGLKQFLADQYANGTPVIVVYPLATETTESVTPQSMNVRSGNNTIEITQAGLDDLELEIEYNWDS